MNAFPNPMGPPPGSRPASPAPPSPVSSHAWHKQILDFSVAVIGPPGLIALVCSLLNLSPRTSGICGALSLAGATGLWFFPQLRRLFREQSLLAKIPWLLNAVMAVALVFFAIPKRAAQQTKLDAQEQTKLLASSWLDWQRHLETTAGLCRKGDTKCFARELTPVLAKRPRPSKENDVTGLASDVIAGQLLLANDNIREILKTRLSVSGNFIGAGFSEPEGQTD